MIRPSKLTDDDIRFVLTSKMTAAALAAHFKVGLGAIKRVRVRDSKRVLRIADQIRSETE